MPNTPMLAMNRPSHATRVLAVLGSSSAAVQAILQEETQLSLEIHDANQCASLPRQAEHQPDIVLLEPPTKDQDRLAAWLRELSVQSPTTPVLVIGELLSVSAVQALLALPASNVMPLPFTRSALLSLISSTMRSNTGSKTNTARCWSFMSAVGGAGATTLAIESAYQLQTMGVSTSNVALIDLNFIDGACAACLDVPANLRLGEVADNPDRIDEALIDAFASPHASGFDVLASTRNPVGYQGINPQAIGRLLDVCCDIYDHVVIDISRWMQDWTLDVAAGSDALVVVSELTVPALHAARDLVMNIETEMPGSAENLHLVLNRMAKRVFGHSISMTEAQKALGRDAAGSISSDWDGAAQAVNYGLPVGQASPKSRIAKDVRALIRTLESKMVDHGAPTSVQVAS